MPSGNVFLMPRFDAPKRNVTKARAVVDAHRETAQPARAPSACLTSRRIRADVYAHRAGRTLIPWLHYLHAHNPGAPGPPPIHIRTSRPS